VVADGIRLVRVSPIVVDDGSRHFEAVGGSGTSWSAFDSPNTAGMNHDHMEAVRAVSSTPATAKWTFDNLIAGASYRVWVTWVSADNRAANALYGIYLNGGASATVTASVNQRLGPATSSNKYRFGVGWYSLGLVSPSGSTPKIVVQLDNNGTSDRVIADAVWVERIS
jgi:hypothetical protein